MKIYQKEVSANKIKLLQQLNNGLYRVESVERNSHGQIVERIAKDFELYSEALEAFKNAFDWLSLNDRLQRAKSIKFKIERIISNLWENPQNDRKIERLHKHKRKLWKFIVNNDPNEQKTNNCHWLDVYFL